MINLNDLHLFVQIVKSRSLAAAGRTLRLPKSTLSYRLRVLEKSLGARLLNRSPRQLTLTDIGEAFYAEAADVVRRAESAEAVVRSRTSEPTGLVRYTAAVAEVQFAMRPVLSDFLALHPKINLFEHATDREVDLLTERFDLAVRAHSEPLRDSELIQRVLAFAPWHIFASANYLATVEPIRQPDDLALHPSLLTRRALNNPAWRLRRENKETADLILQSAPRIISDSMAGLKEMAQASLGLTALPAYICREEVDRGSLVRVLPEWTAGQSTLTALLPENRGVLPATRALLEYLVEGLPRVVNS
jgi:DNA-binding transcriptional LysR family regulator